MFLTMVDTLREIHVRARGLSWVSLPPAERRRVYESVILRIRKNFRDYGRGNEEIAWERVLDLLMERDDDLPALGDPLA